MPRKCRLGWFAPSTRSDTTVRLVPGVSGTAHRCSRGCTVTIVRLPIAPLCWLTSFGGRMDECSDGECVVIAFPGGSACVASKAQIPPCLKGTTGDDILRHPGRRHPRLLAHHAFREGAEGTALGSVVTAVMNLGEDELVTLSYWLAAHAELPCGASRVG